MSPTSIALLALLAQSALPTPVPEDKAKAQELLSDGAALYEKGNYVGALDKFDAAYAAYPSPKIWFNIGQANRDLGRPVESLEAFRRFLDGVPDASPEDKAVAESSVAELQKRLGQLTIVCDAVGAAVTIDGKPAGAAPIAKPIWVVPGPHQVTAVQKGSAPALESVEVTAAGHATVVLKTSPLATPAAASAAAPAITAVPSAQLAAAQPRPDDSRGFWLGRKWTWVAAGSTVLVTGAAAIVGLGVRSRFDELADSCGSTVSGCSQSDIDSLQTRASTANVLWGLAGALALTTGVLFYLEGGPVAIAPVAGDTTGMLARVGF